jgi:hypothetical protein
MNYDELKELHGDIVNRMIEETLKGNYNHAEPSEIVSMKRDIGQYFPDNEQQKDFDIIYKVVIVVRSHPFVKQVISEEETEFYLQMLYSNASTVIKNWVAIGNAFYAGNLEDVEIFEMPFPMKKLSGANCVTVYGTIISSDGVGQSLTLTDETDYQDIFLRLRKDANAMWLHDYVTELSHGVNMNPNGTSKGWETTIREVKKKPVPKKFSQQPLELSKTTSSKIVTECKTMSELMALPDGSTFKVPIGKVTVNHTTGVLNMYGYNEGFEGLKLETGTNLFMNKERKSFAPIVQKLTELGFDLDEAVLLSTPIMVQGVKQISAKGNAWYPELEILN